MGVLIQPPTHTHTELCSWVREVLLETEQEEGVSWNPRSKVLRNHRLWDPASPTSRAPTSHEVNADSLSVLPSRVPPPARHPSVGLNRVQRSKLAGLCSGACSPCSSQFPRSQRAVSHLLPIQPCLSIVNKKPFLRSTIFLHQLPTPHSFNSISRAPHHEIKIKL